MTVSHHIPHSFKRQDAAVTWATFYGVAGLRSLANYWLRSYHTHKVWCGGVDEGLIECDKAHKWFTDYSTSKLVMVCKDRHLRDTMQGGSTLMSRTEWQRTEKQSNILCQKRILLSNSGNSKRRLQWRVKDIGAEYDLMNNLGFNLCVAPWSPVVRWSYISEWREVVR